MTIIALPWPHPSLSPNSRKDRRAATPHRKAYREAGFYAAKEAGAEIHENAELAIKFFPPDRKRRDLDNMLASIKAGLDGIALAACVDDSGWMLSIEKSEPVKGGAVLIQVRQPREDNWQHIGSIVERMINGKVA